MLFRRVWLYAWCLLVVLSVLALWDVSESTCGEHIPILLSRALTTDPWRGWIVVFNLLAVGNSFYFNSVIMVCGFLGFLCAFLVSMFQTNAHNALILLSSTCIMYECYTRTANTWWAVHWWSTLVMGVACTVWLLFSEYGCATQQCSRCSWWYVTEYLFFWSMFLLVLWRIPADEQLRDHIEFTGDTKKESKIMF